VSWVVTLRPAAVTDLADARAWYDQQRAGLGDEFLGSIAVALLRLEENPGQFPIYYREFRRVLVDRFPYKVFFRSHNGTVIVFRILHAAGDHPRQLSNP
jgi:toxin ParE1/3/4